MGVEVCSTSTVGTPYKGRGLSARANRIGKCFFMKKVSKYLKSKTADLTRSAQKIARRLGTLCSPHGQQVPNAWSVDAQRLVPVCPFDGQDRPLDGL